VYTWTMLIKRESNHLLCNPRPRCCSSWFIKQRSQQTLITVCVTANDGEIGEQFLREFQDNEKFIPTILTTLSEAFNWCRCTKQETLF
jgi:hypothetical protein